MTFVKIYDAGDIADKMNAYTESTDDPLIEEFCLLPGNPCKDTVYRLAKEADNENENDGAARLSDAIKRLHLKQSLRTQRMAEAGQLNPGWAIFKMKQQCYGGWTDKQQIDQTIEHKGLNVNIKVSK